MIHSLLVCTSSMLVGIFQKKTVLFNFINLIYLIVMVIIDFNENENCLI